MTRPKDKGTAAETAVVNLLKDTYWPYAERRALRGGKDCGDVTGCPGLMFEVKVADGGLRMGQWLREMHQEQHNSGADYGVLVIKPRGLGSRRTGQWYGVMDFHSYAALLAMGTSTSLVGRIQHSGSAFQIEEWLESARETRGELNDFAAVDVRRVRTHPSDPVELRDIVIMRFGELLELLHRAGYGKREEER